MILKRLPKIPCKQEKKNSLLFPVKNSDTTCNIPKNVIKTFDEKTEKQSHKIEHKICRRPLR